jgi:hypothetical protein
VYNILALSLDFDMIDRMVRHWNHGSVVNKITHSFMTHLSQSELLASILWSDQVRGVGDTFSVLHDFDSLRLYPFGRRVCWLLAPTKIGMAFEWFTLSARKTTWANVKLMSWCCSATKMYFQIWHFPLSDSTFLLFPCLSLFQNIYPQCRRPLPPL